ncbi:MaoC family dehydratase [Herminiimonas fonticola]|uniref:Acyl dehydratase n=1 Tax=Herminiimonas fonticola TaxID=303380 RepID=A0A4R6GIN2_9BURK|nr:MaoC family dehydratase [Herminiimonas fonticola]RBA25728.1 Acyl dehydratase [Herminiimonas fonticola]TDN94836.1 acyl dehydratase [Herminiimonas fonticola]
MRHIASLDELRNLAGQEVAVSDWVLIDQARINQFAQASGDHQWIHVDIERCRSESPYGVPIAHGFLTLSLLPMLLQSAIAFPPCKLAVNYGLNKVRFPAPVPVDSQVRARLILQAVEEFSGGVQMIWDATMECAGNEKPVCVAELILRHYA